MAIPLREVLRDPSLLPAQPTLLCGDEKRLVRWVHSSEVLDLAHLLRGGELLLTAATVLAGASQRRQRRYVRQLVARGVTAVAVEEPDELPEALVDEARRQAFALVQLHRTVPFVGVTENVNGQLINASVSRLRLADSLSEELSQLLTSGGDLQTLVAALAHRLSAEVSVRDSSGHDLATASPPGFVHGGSAHDAPIVVQGFVAAALRIEPAVEVDPDLVDAALDRAPRSFALALLRSAPASAENAAAQAFFEALEQSDQDALVELIGETALSGAEAYVAVVMSTDGPLHSVEQVARGGGRRVLSRVHRGELVAVVGMPGEAPDHERCALIEDIREHTGVHRIGVGPIAHTPGRLSHSVLEARRCLHLPQVEEDVVVDADAFALERLVHRLDSPRVVRDFVEEQLGGILSQEPKVAHRLLETLIAFFDCSANKTATANRLHLQRQTLYHRLGRISEALGKDIADPATTAPLQVAVRLWRTAHHEQQW